MTRALIRYQETKWKPCLIDHDLFDDYYYISNFSVILTPSYRINMNSIIKYLE